IRNRNMRAERNRNRMVRDRAVEIMLVGETFIVKAKVLHGAAMSDDPRPFGRAGGCISETLQDIGDGMRSDVEVAAVDEFHLRRAFLREMNMSVCESGNGRPTFEID